MYSSRYTAQKSWKCNDCNKTFKPHPPDYSCPHCGSNATVPEDIKEQIRERNVTQKNEYFDEENPEKRCPMCGGAMRVGAPTSHTRSLDRNLRWSPPWGKDLPLDAYLCPDCGYVSLYVRDLEVNRDQILKAPTRKIPWS